MSDAKKNVHVDDPLSEVTRRTRKYLLGISALSIAMVQAGIIPSKISALGVELESADQKALLLSVLAVVIYFTLAFCVYAWSDFVQWRSDVHELYAENTASFFAKMDRLGRIEKGMYEEFIDEARNGIRFWNGIAHWSSVARAILEFFVPLLVSGYAIYVVSIYFKQST